MLNFKHNNCNVTTAKTIQICVYQKYQVNKTHLKFVSVKILSELDLLLSDN